MVTLPKPRLDGLDSSVPGAVPVAVTGMVRVGLDAFELRVTSPLTSPVDVGEKIMLKLALCPALNVNGAEMPLRLKPPPVTPI